MATSTTIRFSINPDGTLTDDTEKDVVIEVIDYSTGSPIPGAHSIISGPGGLSFNKYTDINGRINLGVLPHGTYEIVTTAVNYMASNDDFLANDRFTI